MCGGLCWSVVCASLLSLIVCGVVFVVVFVVLVARLVVVGKATISVARFDATAACVFVVLELIVRVPFRISVKLRKFFICKFDCCNSVRW